MCGTVVEVDPNDKKGTFKPGDSIVGTWDLFGIGGLAEYSLVSIKNAAMLPPAVNPVVGAALANSASHAVQIADAVSARPFPSTSLCIETQEDPREREALMTLNETVKGQDGRSRASARRKRWSGDRASPAPQGSRCSRNCNIVGHGPPQRPWGETPRAHWPNCMPCSCAYFFTTELEKEDSNTRLGTERRDPA